jgi:hypothetical protein
MRLQPPHMQGCLCVTTQYESRWAMGTVDCMVEKTSNVCGSASVLTCTVSTRFVLVQSSFFFVEQGP